VDLVVVVDAVGGDVAAQRGRGWFRLRHGARPVKGNRERKDGQHRLHVGLPLDAFSRTDGPLIDIAGSTFQASPIAAPVEGARLHRALTPRNPYRPERRL